MFCVYWVPQYTKNTNMCWAPTTSHYYTRCCTYLTLFRLCKYRVKKVWSPLFTDEEKHSKWGTCPSSHKWWELELWFESISPWSWSSFSFSNITMQLPKIMMAFEVTIVLMSVTHWNIDAKVSVGGYGKSNEGDIDIGEGDVYGLSLPLAVEVEPFSKMTCPSVSWDGMMAQTPSVKNTSSDFWVWRVKYIVEATEGEKDGRSGMRGLSSKFSR